jgi:acyl carrier protein
MADEIESGIIAHIKGLLKGRPVPVDGGTSLIAKGLLDSLDILDLVEFMERTFQVKFATEDLNPDHFETPAAAAALVRRKKGAA